MKVKKVASAKVLFGCFNTLFFNVDHQFSSNQASKNTPSKRKLEKDIDQSDTLNEAIPLNSPKKRKLINRLILAQQKLKQKDAEIKRLRERNRRKVNKILALVSLLECLKKKSFINDEQVNSLKSINVTTKELYPRQLKNANVVSSSKYSPAIRSFALTLHYYSSKAYSYVRKVFNLSLPHIHTIQKWYKSIDGSPGFTTEALETLKLIAKKSKGPLYCCLTMDEMAIRKKIEWDGRKFHGYVDFGGGLDTDEVPEAKEALVFLVTGVNASWKACGCLEVVSGFLLLCDGRRQLMSRLLAAPDALPAPPLQYAALALLAAGLAVCAAAALGCWATYMPSYVILTFYFLMVLGLLVCACAGGVVAAAWPRCAGLQAARGGAVGALQAHYALPDYEPFTAALDLAMTELECCGMTDARNFDLSAWQLRRLGPRGLAVPPACCVQRAPRSHLSPAPLNASRCQDLQPDPQYRHLPGCLGKLEDWYQQQFIVFMLSLFVVALLKLAILLVTIFSCVRLRKHRQDVHSFIMKSIDNKRNENIYETKMGSMHEEPITAKYIQPNNFYSPRVRNPRIFHSKPNEMV